MSVSLSALMSQQHHDRLLRYSRSAHDDVDDEHAKKIMEHFAHDHEHDEDDDDNCDEKHHDEIRFASNGLRVGVIAVVQHWCHDVVDLVCHLYR